MGEPLLNKNIVNYIKIAKENGHKVGLTTNATLLSSELSKQLIDSGLDKIIFSVNVFKKRLMNLYELMQIIIK